MCHYKPRIWKTPVPGNEATDKGTCGKKSSLRQTPGLPYCLPSLVESSGNSQGRGQAGGHPGKRLAQGGDHRHVTSLHAPSTCYLHGPATCAVQAPPPPQVPSSGISDTKAVVRSLIEETDVSAVITDRSTAARAGRGRAPPDGPRRGLAPAAGVRGAPRDDEKSPSLS